MLTLKFILLLEVVIFLALILPIIFGLSVFATALLAELFRKERDGDIS